MKRRESIIILISVLGSIILIFILISNLRSCSGDKTDSPGRFDSTKFVLEKYLIKVDTFIINIVDQVTKVHSRTNVGGNKTKLSFRLPDNTVAWSYYIGVDQASQQAFAEALTQITQVVRPLLKIAEGYGPLAALALNGTSYLTKLQTGENVLYWFVDSTNLELCLSMQNFSSFKNGDVINDFSQMTAPLQGQFYLCLYNDNFVQAIDVTVKITAVVVDKKWGTRKVRRRK